jgi:hypothetical protein
MSYLLYRDAVAVVPSDTGAITASALYIGATGDVSVDMLNGRTNVLFKAVPVGVLAATVTRVYATGTTATNILALRV